ncbi:MAG: hypothetical protein LBQ34_06875 [Alphaproteobacteria bacterium]|jgi:hypothetical protein|nr:hypothetical protein [Alphaproteobacteria bacterium]
MKNRIIQSMIAGFIATIGLSILMIMKSMMGVMPQLDPVAMLSTMAHEKMGFPNIPIIGWILHFMIGTVAWGILFAILYDKIPAKTPTTKGIMFSILPWFLMMIGPMPMSGAGIFGLHLGGIMIPVMTLVMHLVYGAILGYVYGKLAKV